MTGIELLQGIKDGKFKKGDTFKVSENQGMVYIDYENLLCWNNFDAYVTCKTILNHNFQSIDLPLDPKTLRTDDLIQVSNNGGKWIDRYFACYINEKIYCFVNDRNSENTGDCDLTYWEYARLPKEV